MFKGRLPLRYFLLLSGGLLCVGIFYFQAYSETVSLLSGSLKFRSLHYGYHLASSQQGSHSLIEGSASIRFILVFAWISQPTATDYIPGPCTYRVKQPTQRCVGEDMVLPQGVHYQQPSILKPLRTDVLTVTPWLAPIVWDGTFDPEIIDNIYKPLNLTIATTVFAVGKYTYFLRDFLETAEQHYMVGFKVHYYIFTDQPKQVPEVTLAPRREVRIIQVPKFNRWQEISLRRMEIIQTAIEERIHKEADYIYCLDVDMKFHNRWGPEVLDSLVAAIHPWFYYFNREQFTYERRPASMAYIPMDQGDFYYAGAMFGGRIQEVLKMTKTCRENLEVDKINNLEAIWQEESHLNKYFLYRKPAKLLSPEYLWHDGRGVLPSEIKIKRFSGIVKNLTEVRENV